MSGQSLRALYIVSLPVLGLMLATGSFFGAGKWRLANFTGGNARTVGMVATPSPAMSVSVPGDGDDVSVLLEPGQSVQLRVDPAVWGGDSATLSAAASGRVSLRIATDDGTPRDLAADPDTATGGWTGIEVLDDAERVVVASLFAERVGDAVMVSLFGISRTDLLYKVRGAEKSWSEGRLPDESLGLVLETLFVTCNALPRNPAHRLRVLDVVRGEA